MYKNIITEFSKLPNCQKMLANFKVLKYNDYEVKWVYSVDAVFGQHEESLNKTGTLFL